MQELLVVEEARYRLDRCREMGRSNYSFTRTLGFTELLKFIRKPCTDTQLSLIVNHLCQSDFVETVLINSLKTFTKVFPTPSNTTPTVITNQYQMELKAVFQLIELTCLKSTSSNNNYLKQFVRRQEEAENSLKVILDIIVATTTTTSNPITCQIQQDSIECLQCILLAAASSTDHHQTAIYANFDQCKGPEVICNIIRYAPVQAPQVRQAALECLFVYLQDSSENHVSRRKLIETLLVASRNDNQPQQQQQLLNLLLQAKSIGQLAGK